jgi:hypothetical protein
MGTERIVSSYRTIANLRGQNVQTNLMMSLGNCRPTTEREERSSIHIIRNVAMTLVFGKKLLN